MTALSADILTERYGTPDQAPEPASVKMTANTIVYGGSIALLRTGLCIAASSPQSTDVIVGIYSRQTDNRNSAFSGGGSGAIEAPIDRGSFWIAYGTSSDAFTQADVFGSTAYVIDEQTVGKTSSGGTRPVAGIVKAIDTNIGKVAVALGTQAGTIF